MRLCGLADNISFSQDVEIKVALSSLQLSIIELVFVALDKGCLRWGIPMYLLLEISWVKKAILVIIIF